MDNCCDPTPIICTTSSYCTQESSAYCIRYNQGEDLSCIGVVPASNLRLSEILKIMDTKICTITGSGNYASYNVGCLSPVTTQQSWVEKISAYVCTLNTTVGSNYTTLLNMITAITNPNIGTSTQLTITGVCTEIPGLAYTNGVTTLNTHIINMRTAICNTYNLLQTRTDLSSITWNACFASTTNVKTVIQNLIDLVCTHSAQIAAISGAVGPCGKTDSLTFSVDFNNSITSTDICKNYRSITLNKEKLIKTSAYDGCDGYLGDKIYAGTGITTSVQAVTSTIANYSLSIVADVATPENFVSVTISSTLYTAPSAIPVTNPSGIMNYLNSLGKGYFTVALVGSQLTILAQELTALVPQNIALSISGGVNFGAVSTVTTTCEKVVIGLDNTYEYGTWFDPQSYLGTNLYSGTYNNASTSPVKFRLSGQRTVKIKGMVNNSSSASVTGDSNVFTLPSGFRPLERQNFVVASTVAPFTPAIVSISTGGVVTIKGALATFSNTGTYLNITFDID
jgi:hypothetical protein